MKIFGILLPLLSLLALSHGKKKTGLGGKGGGAGPTVALAAPAYYDNSYDDCGDQGNYNLVGSATPMVYAAVPATAVNCAAIPATMSLNKGVGLQAAAPSGLSSPFSKKGKKGSSAGMSFPYQDVLGSLGKGLGFDKKMKGQQPKVAQVAPVAASTLSAPCTDNVQTVPGYFVPVQPSQGVDDCSDSTPSGLSLSYTKNIGIGPVGCGVPVVPSTGVSLPFAKNVGPVAYGVPAAPSVVYTKSIGVDYGTVPVGPVAYSKPIGIDYGTVPVGPVAYEVPVAPSLPSHYYGNPVGYEPISYEPVVAGPSASYPSNIGPVGYGPVSVGPVSYGPVSVGAPYPYPHGNPGAYGQAPCDEPVARVPIGASLSYPKGGHSAPYTVSVSPSVSYGPAYPDVGRPVVAIPGGHQGPSNKFALLGAKKHKGLSASYSPPVQHAVPSGGPYVVVPAGAASCGHRPGCDCGRV